MKKEFIFNIILLLGINFLIKPIYIFGVDLQIQNLVGLESYGMYKVLFNIAFLLQFIHEPGIQSFNSQNIAKNPESLGLHLPKILGLKMILGVVYFVVALSYFFYSDYDTTLLPMMIIIAINLFLSTLFLYLRSNISAIGLYRVDSILSSLDKVLMLLILGFLVWNPSFSSDFKIIWLAYGQLAAFLISCGVALFILRKHLVKFKMSFSWDYSKKLLKWSFPFALILLSMSAYSRMDSIMLERILDDGGVESGIYEYGYRFLDALNIVGYMFAALLIPMYASNLGSKKIIKDLLDTGINLMSVIAALGAATFITYRSEIMLWVNPKATEYYSEILLYLVIGFIFISLAYLFGSLLVANNKLKKLNILLVSGVVLNFVLNYFLIPQEQALGAAKATVITQGAMTLGQIFLVTQVLKINFDVKIWSRVILFGLLCALIFYAIYIYFDFYWIGKAILSICITGILALLLGLVYYENIFHLIRSKRKAL